MIAGAARETRSLQLGPSDVTVLAGDKRRYVALIAHTR